MEISKGKMFRTLFKKDLLLGKNESLLILGFIIIGNLFLYYKAQTTWPTELAFGLSTFLLMFVPISLFFRAFSSISSEWKENTVYLMMSLPVSGSMILISKLLALVTRLIFLLIAALPFTVILFNKLSAELLFGKIVINMELIFIASKYFIIIILFYILYLVMALFSAQIGRLFKKFSGFISLVTFIVTNLIVTTLMEYSYKIARIGGFNINTKSAEIELISFSEVMVAQIDVISLTEFLGSSLLIIILTTAIFLITAAIYDRKVEL